MKAIFLFNCSKRLESTAVNVVLRPVKMQILTIYKTSSTIGFSFSVTFRNHASTCAKCWLLAK